MHPDRVFRPVSARPGLPSGLLVAIFLLSLALLPLRAADTRPNFIILLMDDLGATDLGCYGSDYYRTPHLDRMAREGLQFTQAYAACPVCSPTRASLLTGQHPARLHLTDWLPGQPDRPEQKLRRPALATQLPAGVATLAESLRGAGYATAHVGKWHVGGSECRPQDRGFELNVGGDHRGTPASYFAPYGRGATAMPGLDEAPAGEYLTDRLTAEAVRFIEAPRDRPFFLYLPHFAVHTPLTAKSNVVARHRTALRPGTVHTNPVYAAMIESMDDSVGRILAALEARGLSTNTLVLFTSDNGGLSTREGPHTPATVNTPLRAGKGHLYEGGVRVPLLARWPGTIAPGQRSALPVASTDLHPTLLELAGVKAPAGQASDGASLAGVLRGTGAVAPRPLHWHYPHYSNQGGKPGGAVREGDFKLIEFYESGYLELYHLREDPSETRNLAGTQPELANRLARKLAEWRRAVGAQAMTPNADWKPAPLPQAADGTVLLPAHEVRIHGRQVRYEPPAHKNTIGFWTRTEDWVSWEFAVGVPGTFVVEVLQGCGQGSGGSEVEVSIEGASPAQRVAFTVQDTGHFQKFVRRELGRVTLPARGRHTLAVRPQSKPGVAVMDLREVVLRPVR